MSCTTLQEIHQRQRLADFGDGAVYMKQRL